MAITQYTEPNTTSPNVVPDWQNTIIKLNEQTIGLAEITLSSYADGATGPDIKVGSKFENNGAYFEVDTADETPSGWSGISNSTQAYIKYDESAGEFVYTSTAPTWSDAKQGWYGTGGDANDRYFFRIYKDSGGAYDNRFAYDRRGNIYFPSNLEVETDLEVKNNFTVGNDTLNSGSLTVGSTLTANGGINTDLSSTSSLDGTINLSGDILHNDGSYNTGGNLTNNQVFDSISPVIPSATNYCVLSGGLSRVNGNAHSLYNFAYAERRDTTNIYIYYTILTVDLVGSSVSSGRGSFFVQDGSAAQVFAGSTVNWQYSVGIRVA